ncbi:hypothetical protein [Nocardiopsis sp. LOL_012]|uniref:hypothetical protein n=1 Tax=Nocardiopsis sp. LOL_012 TaxID=3345409 RepID=UPI003A87B0C0
MDESRQRIESVKAHTALGGRLVHGCQSAPSQRGGVVAAYGTPMNRFRDDLAGFRDMWIDRVRSFDTSTWPAAAMMGWGLQGPAPVRWPSGRTPS